MNNAVADAYNAIGAYYRTWRWSRLWDRVEVPAVLTRLPRSGRLLDAGCGYGRYAEQLVSRGFDYSGVDISDRQINLARNLNPALARQFLTGDVSRLPFRDNTFDTIITTRVINHGLARDAVALELSRVLRPGGIIVMTDVAESHKYERVTVRNGSGNVSAPFQRYALRGWLALIQEAGLGIEESTSVSDDEHPMLDFIVARKAD